MAGAPIIGPKPTTPGNWVVSGNGWVNMGYPQPPGTAPKKIVAPPTSFAPPGSITVTTAAGPQSLNLKGIQAQLIKAGYDLPRTSMGKLDTFTKSALADYLKVTSNNPISNVLQTALKGTRITGQRNPTAWSARFGANRKSQKVERPLTGPGGQLDAYGNDPPPLDTTTTIGGPKLNIPGINLLDPNIAKNGLTSLDSSVADKLAGLQFDPQIHQTEIDQARAPVQAKQNLHDIANWYQQVLDSQKTAAGRDTTATTAAGKSVSDATAALVSSLGGSANESAGTVAAGGNASAGTIAALGASQDQYNNDLVPILQNEKAGFMANQQSTDTKRAQDLANTLMDLRGQRGQAVGTNQMNVDKYNNDVNNSIFDRTLNVNKYNTDQRQQNFQNRMSIYNQQVAAMLAGAKIQAANNKITSKGSFDGLSALDKARMRTAMVTNIQQMVKGGAKTAQVVSNLGDLIKTQGWSFSNPAVRDYAYRVLRLAGVQGIDPKMFLNQ